MILIINTLMHPWGKSYITLYFVLIGLELNIYNASIFKEPSKRYWKNRAFAARAFDNVLFLYREQYIIRAKD